MNRVSLFPAAALSLSLLTAGCAGFAFRDAGTARPGLNVAEAALQAGSGQIALQVSETLLRETPDNPGALQVKADALTLLGALDQAAEMYQRLLAKTPPSTRATIGIGRIELSRDPAAAEALFQRVVARDPKDLTALNNLGIARDLRGRHTEARTAYRQALAIDPGLTSAQVNMALSLAMSGQGAEAIQMLKPAATAPDAPVKIRHDYAVVLAMSGQRAEAERILSRDLPPQEVRQVLDGVTGTRTARLPAPDRTDLTRATVQASRARTDTVPPDVVQPIPARTAAPSPAAAPANPPPEVIRPRLADARDFGAPVAQPVDPIAAAAANQRALSGPMPGAEPPPAAGTPVLAGPVAVPIPGAPVPAATAPVATAPVAVAPVTAASVETRGPVPAPVGGDPGRPATARMGSGPAVQFAAAPSEEAAQSYWLELVQRFPAVLGQRAPLVIRFQLNGTVFWRLRTDGFASMEDAQSLCAQMRSGGQDCFVARS